jgi:hypothetical protein
MKKCAIGGVKDHDVPLTKGCRNDSISLGADVHIEEFKSIERATLSPVINWLINLHGCDRWTCYSRTGCPQQWVTAGPDYDH